MVAPNATPLAAANPHSQLLHHSSLRSSDLATRIVQEIVPETSVLIQGRSPRRDDHVRTRDKSTSQKIRDLDARLDAINAGVGAPVTVDTLIKQTEPPFTERILRARISSKFKLPAQLGIYEGKTDPMDHLDSYKSLMSLQGCSDEIMCKAFSATLKGPARSWFRKLSPGTIDSFGDLSRLFVANFMSCRNRQKNASHLFTIHQKENESLKEFVKRFNQAILEVEDPSDKVIIMAMMEGLRPGPLFDSLSKNVPETLSALQSKADKYIAAEELSEAKRRRRGKDDHKRKEPDTRRADYREETRYKRPDRDPKRSNNRRPRTPPRRPEFILPPLNAPIAQVLSEIKHEEFVKWPGKIKTDPQKRNRNKYCEFHRDHGHNTEDCFQLKEQIADLIKRGYLRKYITDRPPPNSPERRYGDNRPTAGNIQTIHGGFGSGGCSTSSRKKHARSALRSVEEEVYNLSSPCVGDQPPITFGSDDLRGLHLPHDDALDFIVVDCPSPYNAILGRPTLGGIKAITSTYHLKMKFPSLTGIGEVKGDQKVARQCFISAMKEGILPRDKLQARRLQYRSARFCIFKGRLYKRSFSGPLLRCLRPEEAKFGVPKVIISDNARQFDNDRFRLFCSDLAISHHFSSPGHPQANGQVEVTNRTILRNLKARLERSKSEWAENLPSILWAYHTTSRIPTETNEAELRLNLDLLEERREIAQLRQTAYKCQVAKYYNQRVRHRSFLPGDLVLRKVTLSTKEPNAGKLGPTWEGPYKVIKVSRPGTYWLEDLDGKALSHPWNAEHLKKYYQ
ncbi:hypothetical protein Acr_00g0073880 [Actinidia rufa]|uniref:Integrase catalytic domain-containing protein n=1 Tax=Actinidia rufa TaxID=165716 RepID=A0A7J0DSP8_9ERIC|nr:hypothetical protein Acr_00g0073880 [Actinidia rufa]